MEDEAIGSLDLDAAVEKVIVGDEVRLYRTRSVVAYLDGPVYCFDAAEIRISNPTPVVDDDLNAKVLGFANILIQNCGAGPVPARRLVADIVINYSCEERLLAETGAEAIYPQLKGLIKTTTPLFLNPTKRLLVTQIKINSIVLTRTRPQDPRLDRFGVVPV
jgi:hypothetical protein